jgi:flagellar biosynthesis protein FlhG
MIPIERLKVSELQDARVACAYLFSSQAAVSDAFIKKLDFETLRKSYLEKVKMYHPDLHRQEKKEIIDWNVRRFIKARRSYEILSSFFDEKNHEAGERYPRGGKIIAIGGGKGGIGKSLFAANLGVFLAKKGFKTVLVDLDLGGANLHLYLGEMFIKKNVNDFINNKLSSLHETMIPTKYGPLLIGGDGSRLGAANISHMRKIKLMNAIKKIDADYIVIDLGGDTSFNMSDFFLMADHGIVMTTCDPASYVDAFSFIKTTLYRKLNRLFGPESKYAEKRDLDLEALIRRATDPSNGSKLVRMESLVAKVKKEMPRSLPVLSEAILAFNPHLVVNKVPQNYDASQIVDRIRDVAAKSLSVNVRYLASIGYRQDVEESARSLIPVVSGTVNCDLAKSLNRVSEGLGIGFLQRPKWKPFQNPV